MKNKKKMPLKARKFLKVWVTAVLVIFVIGAMALTCFAAEDDPITVVNNLSDFMFGLVRAVGMIMLGFAVVPVPRQLHRSGLMSGRSYSICLCLSGQ